MAHPNVRVTNLLGENGGDFINDTAAKTGVWSQIQCVADCTFSVLTGNLSGTLTGITLAAGASIYGRFTAITLASGAVIAYKV